MIRTVNFPVSSRGVLRRTFSVVAIFCVAGAASLTVDMPVSRASREILGRAKLSSLWALAETFGDGLGVLYIALAIFVLSKAARPYLPRVLVCAYGAGLAADIVKIFIVRVRPRAFGMEGSVLQSFQGFRPWESVRQGWSIWDSGMQSFPSAHTATATGLAMGLAWLFPRGRWAFAALAALVACQRVVVGAHFPSDTLVGAAVGCLVAAYCVDCRGLGPRFDRWEARLRDRKQKREHPEPPSSAAESDIQGVDRYRRSA